MRSRPLRSLLAAGVVALVATAAPAWAHVTIQPGEADAGGFATQGFQVPNERDDASTVQVEVELPTDHPIAFVSIQPVPGWTINVERTTLDQPVASEGGEITDVVSKITWSGGEIAPGQFQVFPVSMGPLPTDTNELVFEALQTYSDGEVVRWIDEPTASGEEPEHPAPVLTLSASTGDAHGGDTADAPAEATAESDDSGDDDGNGLAIGALVVGALGLVTGGVALVGSRRRG
jgi:periplasmic copper chaperone A